MILRPSYGKLPEFLPNSLGLGSVIFSQQIVNFEARLEKVFDELKLLRFHVKCGQYCGE